MSHDVQPTDLADPQNPDSEKPSGKPADSSPAAEHSEQSPEQPTEAAPAEEPAEVPEEPAQPTEKPAETAEELPAVAEKAAEATEEPIEVEPTVAAAVEATEKTPGRVRRILRSPRMSQALNVLAGVLVFAALLYPNVLRRLTLGNFARIPIEAAFGILLLIVLPRRPRLVVGSILGAGLGWLIIQKSLDMGWFKTLARPFDVILDWELFDDTFNFIRDSYGAAGAWGAAIGAIVLAAAVVAMMIWAVLRLAALITEHRRRSALAAAGIASAWMLSLAVGLQLLPAVPVAARTSVTYAWDRAWQAKTGIANEAAFAEEVKADPYKNVPPDQLLTALRGKDVVITFVESYGRNAVESPSLAAGTTAVLEAGDAKLKAAGFAARSGWLTSSTFGGNSWLAHSTLLSGLWINNQSRYRNLTASDRLTIPSAMQKAGWDTVSVMPGATRAFPEGKFYGYNRIWDSRNLSYQGPRFSWAQMPDQYTLKQFTEVEYNRPGRKPLMVEMPLISSHTPWAPIPTFIDWDQVGDGSVYNAIAADGAQKADIWSSAAKVRREYGKSIRYTLTTLISWIEKYGNDDLVLVFLGDHQPSSVVTGDNASHDVPITIVAKDPAVLDRIAPWNWTPSLKPAPDAPVWQMNTFRDRFFTAFGPDGGTH
ncbi:phosphoglycerol transferase MdoB-like AlkP superfamily enzyme [Actinoplanes xinjiangensis]|uniref:Phosphoglycerol transferase MdoB-like AlkP superfamily enzyme n=1 Tax=Actinoplanes xinjiangensis TaxID=512350 RepID=A0A316F9M0_9ACTN|nr:phosphoglycerol transferase MdoB-like AlkP superfamily enzyme [Actinoplanes xinjiangensis]